jgi:NADH-quinone oxidoreductase E subunit
MAHSHHEVPAPQDPQFSAASLAEVERHCQKYPDRGAGLLPALYVAQDQFGWISPPVMALVARTLGVTEARVREVATWYTMFNKRPVGRYHLQVCTNVSCHILGADTVVQEVAKALGIPVGGTTPDGKFTLTEVECLASCGSGPCMQVNRDYHEHVTVERALQVVRSLP